MIEWKCHVCRKTRSDDKISVRKKRIGWGMTMNIRYCNDNPTCVEQSKTFDFGLEKKVQSATGSTKNE